MGVNECQEQRLQPGPYPGCCQAWLEGGVEIKGHPGLQRHPIEGILTDSAVSGSPACCSQEWGAVSSAAPSDSSRKLSPCPAYLPLPLPLGLPGSCTWLSPPLWWYFQKRALDCQVWNKCLFKCRFLNPPGPQRLSGPFTISLQCWRRADPPSAQRAQVGVRPPPCTAPPLFSLLRPLHSELRSPVF